MKIGTLVPWFGSNRMNAKFVASELQYATWVGIPFCGGLSEVAYLPARTIVCNDLHRHIINLCLVLQDKVLGPRFIRHIRRLPFHSEMVLKAKLELKWKVLGKLDFDAAVNYFLIAWMCRSGVAGTKGEFNAGLSVRWEAQGGDSVIRYRSAIDSLTEWRRIMERCTFLNIDYREFLNRCDDRAKNAIYCDPPFPGPGEAYKHGIINHAELFELLNKFNDATVLVRYYKNEEIEKLYKDWKKTEIEGRDSQNGTKIECYYRRN